VFGNNDGLHLTIVNAALDGGSGRRIRSASRRLVQAGSVCRYEAKAGSPWP
jgi:hypothetical protein